MSFTALKRSIIALSVAVLILPSLSWAGETGASVVARLYKDFAWQAMVSTDSTRDVKEAFGKDIAHQSRSVLEQYFDQNLSSLIIQDADCVAKSREICNLDFDPLFASQDPGATDLVIKQTSSGTVRAEYTYPSNQKKIRVDYHLAVIESRWRITDITYPNLKGVSLRSLLRRKYSRPQ